MKQLARKRLQFAEQFMENLDLENRAGDLEDILLEQQLTRPAPTKSRAVV